MSATPASSATEMAALLAASDRLFIAGRWVDARDGGRMTVLDPATDLPLIEIADATLPDGLDALAAADRAFPLVRSLAPRERADILRRAHDLLMEREETLALLMTLEMGKPLAESRGEVAYAAAYLRWYSEEAVRIDGRFGVAENGGSRVLTLPRPVGPCLFITPWNFPLAMGARKIAPALAAGCTCVVKPAPQTPLSMLALARILDEAGAPPGAVNVVTSSAAGEVVRPLIADSRLRKLSFTGSTAVGRTLIAQSAEQVLRVSMELGGNAPFIVFGDADLESAVDGAMAAKLRNGGQACTAANRFLVHASLARPFALRLTERFSALRVGRGTEECVDVGPLIDHRQRDRVVDLVHDALDRGARALCGAGSVGDRGSFYAPTVLVDVPIDATLLHEEIFGPVAPITAFDDDNEAIMLANTTEYGLAAYVYTRDLARALRVSEALDTGMVGLNQGLVSNAGAPFGGVKASGFGREGGPEGLREYLETTYVALNSGA